MPSSSEKVSIIMAAYNGEKTIEQAIQSVLDQTYSTWELLVVDDFSSDNTSRLVQSFVEKDDRILYFRNECNLGVSETRKRALDMSTGKWIAILDCDDCWDSHKLEKQMRLQQATNGHLFYTGSAFMNQTGCRLDAVLHVPSELTYRKLLKQNLLSNSSALVDRELYKKYYVIGDQMHEDFALWLNILKLGYKAYGIDEPLLVYRLSDSSKSSNKIKAAKMNWNTYMFIGLSKFSAVYYMICYMVNGIKKYSELR